MMPSEAVVRLDEMKRDGTRLDDLARKGIISHRLSQFGQQLRIMEFATAEAEEFAKNGDIVAASRSLVDVRLARESPYAIWVQPMFDAGKVQLGGKLPSHIQTFIDYGKELFERATRRVNFAYTNRRLLA